MVLMNEIEPRAADPGVSAARSARGKHAKGASSRKAVMKKPKQKTLTHDVNAMTAQLKSLQLESAALQQEGQQLRLQLSVLESTLGAYSALMLLSSKGWALFGSASTTAQPATGNSSTASAQGLLQANLASCKADLAGPRPHPPPGAACGMAGCSTRQLPVPAASAAAAGAAAPPAAVAAAAAATQAALPAVTAAAGAAVAAPSGLVEARRRAMVQGYQTYLMQAFVVQELCSSAAAAGWRPPPPPTLDIPLLDQLPDVEAFHLDLHSLWQGRMAGVLPPGVELPVFPFSLAQLAECTREEIWGFMNSDMSTGEPCTPQQITEDMPATWRRVAAAGIFRPDQVQFLLRLHHLYVRGLQGLRMEQLQLQHSIKAMQQQLAAGARRSTATGSGRASPASAHHGDSSEAAAARDSSSSNTAGPPLSGAVCVHATQAAQRDLQHVPLEDGAGGADLHVWDQRMAVVPQQQQQQQQQQQRGQGVDLGVDVESAGPVAAAAVQGACSTGGQGGPCGRHLALDGWFEGSGASEEACAQLELQFRAAQAKEDAVAFAISSTMARALDPLQHVEVLTACWPFYIHGVEVLCALAEQQQQQWVQNLCPQQKQQQQDNHVQEPQQQPQRRHQQLSHCRAPAPPLHSSPSSSNVCKHGVSA